MSKLFNEREPEKYSHQVLFSLGTFKLSKLFLLGKRLLNVPCLSVYLLAPLSLALTYLFFLIPLRKSSWTSYVQPLE